MTTTNQTKVPAVLFDTEMIYGDVDALDGGLYLFQRPIGQRYALGRTGFKTYDDTNMCMAAQLPSPFWFEFEGAFASLQCWPADRMSAVLESLKHATLTVGLGPCREFLVEQFSALPVCPMSAIRQENLPPDGRMNWRAYPHAYRPLKGALGISNVLTATVKWKCHEACRDLPDCKLRVAFVGYFCASPEFWTWKGAVL